MPELTIESVAARLKEVCEMHRDGGQFMLECMDALIDDYDPREDVSRALREIESAIDAVDEDDEFDLLEQAQALIDRRRAALLESTFDPVG